MKTVNSVELLGIEIDDKLSFNLDISKICDSASNQYDSFKDFMTINIKEALINNYFMSNFNHCFLVWMFFVCKKGL